MSFLNKVRTLVASTRAKHKAKAADELAELLRCLDGQLHDAAQHLKEAVENEAQTTARGYLDLQLQNTRGKDLETRPGLLEADDIKSLAGYRALLAEVETFGLHMRLNEELNHAVIEVENDDLAWRTWRVRVEGWKP